MHNDLWTLDLTLGTWSLYTEFDADPAQQAIWPCEQLLRFMRLNDIYGSAAILSHDDLLQQSAGACSCCCHCCCRWPATVYTLNFEHQFLTVLAFEQWIFGGQYLDITGVVTYYNDLFAFNLQSSLWEPILVGGDVPSPRASQGSLVLSSVFINLPRLLALKLVSCV